MGDGELDFWFLQVRVVGSRAEALKPGCSDKRGWSMPYGHLKSAGVRGEPFKGRCNEGTGRTKWEVKWAA